MKLLLGYESVLTRKPILELTGLTVREVQIVPDALVAIANESEVSYSRFTHSPQQRHLSRSHQDFLVVLSYRQAIDVNTRRYHFAGHVAAVPPH